MTGVTTRPRIAVVATLALFLLIVTGTAGYLLLVRPLAGGSTSGTCHGATYRLEVSRSHAAVSFHLTIHDRSGARWLAYDPRFVAIDKPVQGTTGADGVLRLDQQVGDLDDGRTRIVAFRRFDEQDSCRASAYTVALF